MYIASLFFDISLNLNLDVEGVSLTKLIKLLIVEVNTEVTNIHQV
jgi:hypothetical protein